MLPLFFVLHGYIDNMEAMSLGEALLLFGEYVLVSLVIFGAAFLLFGSRRKAALFSFSVMFFHLFFGAGHDALKRFFPSVFFTKYLFILPAALVLFICTIVYFRKTRKEFKGLTVYLNFLFLLLIVIDVPRLVMVSSDKKGSAILANATVCDTCDKPDVYLIIADEYADSTSLQQIFGFNNTAFQTALRKRGFHIVRNSRSNYNFTAFAMASLFQMDYLGGVKGRNQNLADKNKCYKLINDAGLWDFFSQHGYAIKNHSVFNLANIPTEAPQNYMLIGKGMIVSNTLLARVDKDLRYHLALTFKIESEVSRITYFMNRCNQLLLSRLMEETVAASIQPRFVYT
ncbi:MAG TPA: hypothetical protein VER36_07350, partial [Flavisolibacter sp.]|nr:hypothetical protein [Flavisolibacter sp.]